MHTLGTPEGAHHPPQLNTATELDSHIRHNNSVPILFCHIAIEMCVLL
jgi:hypothetical protein